MQRIQHGKLIKSSLVGEEPYNVYIPEPLPPIPEIDMTEISKELEKANIAIGELNGAYDAGIDPFIINYMYVRKEAVLSSQIEGTQSTLDDLMRYESGTSVGVPVDDVAEVSSYIAAMSHGLKRIQGGFPLSLRLIREIHKVLLTNARGHHKMPGEFRWSQNWIGGTRPGNANFVPASPEMVPDLLSDMEKFIHEKDNIPVLVKAALIHQQFETIHPFLDGNGRVGRLLITFFLCVQGFLRSPYLYLSLFFKRHRNVYYETLSEPRKTGDWEKWINFFLEGVTVSANDAKSTLFKIKNLFFCDDLKVRQLGRSRNSAEQVFTIFKQKPLLTIAEILNRTSLTKPTAISSVKHLIDLGLIQNKSERKWGQIYSYTGYADLISSDGA